MAANVSYASPTADAKYAPVLHANIMGAILSRMSSNMNGWTIALSIFLALVVYDQCALLVVLRTSYSADDLRSELHPQERLDCRAPHEAALHRTIS